MKRTFILFQIILSALLLSSAFLIYLLYDNTHTLYKLEQQRQSLISEAMELYASSQNLTAFAQQYVVSGDETFKQDFHHLLAMRMGQMAKPESCPCPYWQLLEPIRSLRHPLGGKQALHQRILALPFTEQEERFLLEAEEKANALADIDLQAIKTYDGYFIENSDPWQFIEKDHAKAKELLFSKSYTQAQHKIALPIDKLLVSVRTRFNHKKNQLESYRAFLADLLPIAFVVIFILVLALFKVIYSKLAKYYSSLEHLSFIDHLTKAYNRRYLFEVGNKFIEITRREANVVGVILFDIDHFKKINDRYGHVIGDKMLVSVAYKIRSRIRQSDLFFRYGGEEFLLLVRLNQDSDLFRLSEKIRQAIADEVFVEDKNGRPVHCTISAGVVSHGHDFCLQSMIMDADKALYQAKDQGRNQTVVFQEEVY